MCLPDICLLGEEIMKIMFASDVHGDAECARKMLEAYSREGAQKLCLLGDLLYHGPRNDIPSGYDPKSVIAMLNGARESLLCVRGNCDTEVDQMVIDFPILSDSAEVFADGIAMHLEHGHRHGADDPPPLREGELLICGHTHVPRIKPFGKGNVYINVGSVSLPKEGNERTYAIYEDGTFRIKTLDGGKIINEIKIN